MSYLDKAHDPRRRAKAFVAVGAIHAILAYGVVTGLGVDIRAGPVEPPLKGEQIPLTPPPPPEPTPPKPVDRVVTPPVAPLPPIDLTGPTEVVRLPIDDAVPPLPAAEPDPRPPAPPLPPPRPSPSFTPKRAVPSGSSAGWITSADYPRRPLVDGIEGSVRYRLVVAPSGRVAGCELTRSSGNRALDDATCRLLTNRARFDPATDENGAKVVGSYAGSVTWAIPD